MLLGHRTELLLVARFGQSRATGDRDVAEVRLLEEAIGAIVASIKNMKSPRISPPCSLRIAAEFVSATKLECR